MPLIKQIQEAVNAGDLPQPFTTEELKRWMKEHQIVKDNGEPYAPASIDAILSNSDSKNIPTSNRNFKPLQSRLNSNGNYEYWF